MEQFRVVLGPHISIHALREEGDICLCSTAVWPLYFYPRPPRGGRQPQCRRSSPRPNFYPRPPRGGRHILIEVDGKTVVISIHALREEGDR